MNSVDEWLGWIPIRLYGTPTGPWLDWCFVGESQFADPFFDHSIDRLLRDPFKLLFRRQTPLASLLDGPKLLRLRQPTGFIFHMSHCGSTLVSQLLATSPAHFVISEASVIETVLRTSPADATNDHRIGWLQAIVCAMIRPRREAQGHSFVKFDSWHAVHLPLIRQAFPDVPWIFLYRDPVEILVSLSKQSGGRTVPGRMNLREAELYAAPGTDPAQYHARILAEICGAAIASHAPGLSRFVNYQQLPAAVVQLLPQHFGLSLTEELETCMLERAGYDGKDPDSTFRSDTDFKQRSATDAMRAAVSQWLPGTFEMMEQLSST